MNIRKGSQVTILTGHDEMSTFWQQERVTKAEGKEFIAGEFRLKLKCPSNIPFQTWKPASR